MMGKLMKYDLKSMLKVIVPFWIAMFVTGILWSAQAKLTLLDINVADSRGNLIMGITMLLFLLLIMAVVVMNIVVIIQRFWKGLLKEEGYLMFTIPVSEKSDIVKSMQRPSCNDRNDRSDYFNESGHGNNAWNADNCSAPV